MTDANDRLAEILADYTATMAGLQSPTPTEDFDRRILRPADQQRPCRVPEIGPRA